MASRSTFSGGVSGTKTVAEVKDQRPRAQNLENMPRRALHRRAAHDGQLGIEIALKNHSLGQHVARPMQRHRGIEAERLDSGLLRDTGIEGPRTAGKRDDGGLGRRCAYGCDDSLDRLDAPAVELRGRKHARPAIEQLHRLRTGLDLANQKRRYRIAQHVNEA